MKSHLLVAVAQVWAKQIKNGQQNFAVFSLIIQIYSGMFCDLAQGVWMVWGMVLKEGKVMLSTFLCQQAIIALVQSP